MGMVFCRGCGKEIHDTAHCCPLCGALQAGPVRPRLGRSFGRLAGWGFVWMCVIWVTILFVLGFAAGVIDPENAGAKGQELGEALAGPLLLVAIVISGILTWLGKLPGTKRAAT